MTALRRIAIVTVEKGTPRTEVWRALLGASSFKADCGKICIAVDDDIDPENSDAIFWAIAFRMNPEKDLQVLPHRSPGHGPEREHVADHPPTGRWARVAGVGGLVARPGWGERGWR